MIYMIYAYSSTQTNFLIATHILLFCSSEHLWTKYKHEIKYIMYKSWEAVQKSRIVKTDKKRNNAHVDICICIHIFLYIYLHIYI